MTAWPQLAERWLRELHGWTRRGDALVMQRELAHFQAALDWDDAEMWLEGAIQNDWSVSQMRGRRWETLETPPAEQRREVAAEQAQLDEESKAESAVDSSEVNSVQSTTATVSAGTSERAAGGEPTAASGSAAEKSTSENVASAAAPEQPARIEKRTKLSVDVENLPDDLAEAFDAFKLAILHHKTSGWEAISCDVHRKRRSRIRRIYRSGYRYSGR